MWKFSVRIYVYKIKIQICVDLPGTVFLVILFVHVLSNNQQFSDAFHSSMGALSTGFPFSGEVATPAHSDKESLLSFSWTILHVAYF